MWPEKDLFKNNNTGQISEVARRRAKKNWDPPVHKGPGTGRSTRN